MEVAGKVVVVTGGGNGIGKAMCRRFAKEGATVVVSDLDANAAEAVAAEIGGVAIACDVSDESQLISLVEKTAAQCGPIDIFCSNAGVGFGDNGTGNMGDATAKATDASNKIWDINIQVNLMSHVYAARAVLPSMIERGTGYFVNTASAAGLLAQIGDAAYTTTKHAAIGFAESLQITHGDDGIVVSVICPQYVATNMTGFNDGDDFSGIDGVIGPDVVAEKVLQGIREERFLILTHDEVETFRQRKAADYDRWLTGMRKLRQKIIANNLLDFKKNK
jgi:NAD(P)-dependent dehydrogenase (short-subunit alcohol dehydrogenase family)